jgi:hypothetical protein
MEELGRGQGGGMEGAGRCRTGAGRMRMVHTAAIM